MEHPSRWVGRLLEPFPLWCFPKAYYGHWYWRQFYAVYRRALKKLFLFIISCLSEENITEGIS